MEDDKLPAMFTRSYSIPPNFESYDPMADTVVFDSAQPQTAHEMFAREGIKLPPGSKVFFGRPRSELTVHTSAMCHEQIQRFVRSTQETSS